MSSSSLVSLKQDLLTKGFNIQDDWLNTCINTLNTRSKTIIYRQLLCTDVGDWSKKSIPSNLKTFHKKIWNGIHVLQIENIINLCYSSFENANKNTSSNPKCLKLKLTDGYNTIYALKYSQINNIKLDLPKGTKICLNNPEIRRGYVLLTVSNTKILNGSVISSNNNNNNSNNDSDNDNKDEDEKRMIDNTCPSNSVNNNRINPINININRNQNRNINININNNNNSGNNSGTGNNNNNRINPINININRKRNRNINNSGNNNNSRNSGNNSGTGNNNNHNMNRMQPRKLTQNEKLKKQQKLYSMPKVVLNERKNLKNIPWTCTMCGFVNHKAPDWICEICNEAHHINQENNNNDDDDIIILDKTNKQTFMNDNDMDFNFDSDKDDVDMIPVNKKKKKFF